jgi:hypothetical protein
MNSAAGRIQRMVRRRQFRQAIRAARRLRFEKRLEHEARYAQVDWGGHLHAESHTWFCRIGSNTQSTWLQAKKDATEIPDEAACGWFGPETL